MQVIAFFDKKSDTERLQEFDLKLNSHAIFAKSGCNEVKKLLVLLCLSILRVSPIDVEEFMEILAQPLHVDRP